MKRILVSRLFISFRFLFPDAKPLENAAKDFIVGDGAEDGAEVIETVAQVL